jgi:hypothetical protein
MEIMAMGSPILVNRYGLDSEVIPYLKQASIFSNLKELEQKFRGIFSKSVSLDDYRSLNSEDFRKSLNDRFTIGIRKIREFG